MLLDIADFDYILPPELVAQTPLTNRTDSCLLDARQNSFNSYPCFYDLRFSQIGQLLQPYDILVFNNTKVIPARLYGHKITGGKFECLIDRITSEYTAWVHAKSSKMPVIGSVIIIGNHPVYVLDRHPHSGGLLYLKFTEPILNIAHKYGQLPLPPYITHIPTEHDHIRYQTVYAQHEGAVAAPTAGLHFDNQLLNQLSNQGIAHTFITLHVGAGTFLPIRNDDIDKHTMHSEWFTVPQSTVDAISLAKSMNGRVICVGTTSLRALESAASFNSGNLCPYSGDTQLFIKPGYQFNIVDCLITNFHLPKSTLMMLVSAFSGTAHIQAAYAHAIKHKYRFFSYGDAMFLNRIAKNCIL